MMTLPKLIASDIDGTLLKDHNVVSKRTREAIQRCIDEGIKVVLATGRPPEHMQLIADQIAHSGYAICSNGALTLDLKQDAVIDQQTIDKEVAKKAVLLIKEVFPELMVGAYSPSNRVCEPAAVGSFFLESWPDVVVADSLEEVFEYPTNKLLLWREDLKSIIQLAPEFQRVSGHLVNITWASDHVLEVGPKGVNKSTALTKLCSQLNISPEDVLAFGDMPNDLEMLSWAGTGIAMGNALEEVKQRADGVTDTHDRDGVAKYLEQLFD